MVHAEKEIKMAKEVYRHYQDAAQPIVHTIVIEDGVVVDAYVYQVLGDYRSSGDWERGVLRQPVENLDLSEYKRQR